MNFNQTPLKYYDEKGTMRTLELILKANFNIDNGTTHINIPTHKNWKCKRKGCKIDYKHLHSTYV